MMIDLRGEEIRRIRKEEIKLTWREDEAEKGKGLE